MISSVSGLVTRLSLTSVEVTVGGFGVTLLCTAQTGAALRLGQTATLATSLVVREDSLTLFGFAEADERDTFELLQTASGVGPKLAQAALSVLSPDDLRAAIAAEDLTTLVKVPGVGRKGAQRIVLELKDRIGAPRSGSGSPPAATTALWREQVSQGLQGLGWSAKDAEAACDGVSDWAQSQPPPAVGDLMRAALKSLARR